MIYRRLAWFRKYVEGRWRALSRWLQVNALAPEWLPPRWRQPLVGYLLAVTLTLLAIALEVGAVHLLPHIDAVSGVFVFLLILFVGLNWGAGPSLLATVLGTFLLVYLIYPPPFTITWKNVTDMLQAGLVLFGGLFVAQTASQRGRQRREAEQRAYEAERERRRQRAMLETLLAMVAALVQTPPAAEAEMPAEDLVFQRLAELLSYALGGQRISLWSLEPETEMLTLLGAVGHSPDQAPPWRDISGQRVPAHAWLEARLLARLQDGEAVYTELPLSPNGASPSRKTRLLVVPIQRDHTLLGLVTFDPPWTTAQAPTEDLALLQAMARLGALVIERERLLSARELAQAEALAQRESRRQMEAFLGIAGHELKTPLTSIVLALQAAQRRLDHLTHQEATEQERTTVLGYMQLYVGHLTQSVGRLERLVHELLDSTRIEAGQLTLHRERADLRAIVSDAVAEQRSLTPDRTIRLQVPPEQPILVCADAQRIGQVVSTYLSNALKYSAEVSPVEVGVAVEGQQGRVWVQDAGPGIPAGRQESLWKRFYRAPETPVQSGSGVGLGLGLYISRTLIEQHQGQVGVESTPGEGSTFWFTLPLEQHGTG